MDQERTPDFSESHSQGGIRPYFSVNTTATFPFLHSGSLTFVIIFLCTFRILPDPATASINGRFRTTSRIIVVHGFRLRRLESAHKVDYISLPGCFWIVGAMPQPVTLQHSVS